jgi:SAM-dependent methyltransferase
MGITEGMKILDVGCGVGGPAREIVKFTGANIVGLNNNDYQIERATRYAAKEGLSDNLSFVKGDFMVRYARILPQQSVLTCSSKCPFLKTPSTPSTQLKRRSTPRP